MTAVFRLNGLLAEQLPRAGKGIKKLIIQIIAVRNHEDGGVIHRQHNLARIKHHRERLTAALCVPHHTALAVTGRVAFSAGQAKFFGVFVKGFVNRVFAKPCCAQGGGYRFIDRVILMIRGELLNFGNRDNVGKC